MDLISKVLILENNTLDKKILEYYKWKQDHLILGSRTAVEIDET